MRSLCIVLAVLAVVNANSASEDAPEPPKVAMEESGAAVMAEEPALVSHLGQDARSDDRSVDNGVGEEYPNYYDDLPLCEEFNDFNSFVLNEIRKEIASGDVEATVQKDDEDCKYTNAAINLTRRTFPAQSPNLVDYFWVGGMPQEKELAAETLWREGKKSDELKRLLTKNGKELIFGCAYNSDTALCVFSGPIKDLEKVLAEPEFPEHLGVRSKKSAQSKAAAEQRSSSSVE